MLAGFLLISLGVNLSKLAIPGLGKPRLGFPSSVDAYREGWGPPKSPCHREPPEGWWATGREEGAPGKCRRRCRETPRSSWESRPRSDRSEDVKGLPDRRQEDAERGTKTGMSFGLSWDPTIKPGIYYLGLYPGLDSEGPYLVNLSSGKICRVPFFFLKGIERSWQYNKSSP